ncbi:molybdopterin-dependent oxidoreductase [Candidatus Bipolaricaulota sp. J31]
MRDRVVVELTVNGRLVRREVFPDMSLLSFLREELGLTGAKNGCDGKGICGACTVIVNGETRKSCLLRMGELSGAEVVTIEGLSPGGLHPLQAAFVREGAVQCGFCTPGMIMAAAALLNRDPSPTEAEIKRAIQGNLCRCTGYVKIVRAIQRAAEALRKGERLDPGPEGDAPPQPGAPLPPKRAVEKVTGAFRFLDDLPAGDALVLKVVWSAYPHARIKSIDTEAAEAVPGVVRVLTAADVPGRNAYGLIKADQPVLCEEKVRYTGDPVALVVAEDRAAAERGAKLVRVEYEPLPPVFSPEEALGNEAPPLFPAGNVACRFSLKQGNPEEAFSQAALVVEGEFTTQAIEHAYLEPEAGIAEWDKDKLVVRAACQYPQAVQRQLAEVLGVPEARIRVIAHPTGGAFGGKTDISVHALLALAAWHTRRRVKLVLTREESLRMSVKRHPMRLRYRIAFDPEGRILGMWARILANCGAYQTLSIPLLEQTTAFSTGPYRVPHADVEVVGAFTNTPPSSAMRGFGIPQPTFAVESLLDEAARKLGLSPFEIRRRNALRPGDISVTGQRMPQDTHLLEVLDALEEEYHRLGPREDPHTGVGIACGYKNVGLGLGEDDYAEASVEILPSGKVVVRTGAVELGQGAETVLAQLAASALGVPYEAVDVLWGDTDTTPDARETNASRQTVVSGNAVLQAAEDLKRRALKRARGYLAEPLSFEEGKVVGSDGRAVSLFDLARDAPLVGHGRYVAPATMPLGKRRGDTDEYRNYFAYSFFANLAVVKVDPDRGRVRVKKLVSAYDVGRALNRLAVEGQLEGGAVMGVGYALSEEYIPYGEGATVNLAQCRLPRATDTPEIVCKLVELCDSLGPYGAKGLGEVAMIAVAPAIANAIRDAVGVRLYSLPMRPERIKQALQGGEGTEGR